MRLPLAGLLLLAACSPPGGNGDRAARALDTAATAAPVRPQPPVPVLPPSTDSSVSWQRLTDIIRDTPDSVLAVRQTHSRRVSVQLRDGRRYHATEPSMDAIIRLLKQVDPAGRILIATE